MAESGDIVTVEGNTDFPEAALGRSVAEPSPHTSVCPWKGVAHDASLRVGG